MRIEVQAQAYSNVFLIAGITTLAAVGLAFVLRTGSAYSVPAAPSAPATPSAPSATAAEPAEAQGRAVAAGRERSARRGLAHLAGKGLR
jgi:hypothetical protein